MERSKILTIQFVNKITRKEIEYFRGAIIRLMEENGVSNVLFHNHLDDKFNYRYPLVQYKIINGRASIICISEGVDLIADCFKKLEKQFVNIGNRTTFLEIQEIKLQETEISVIPQKIVYRLENWLGFNQDNIKIFENESNFVKKYQMIQKTIIANIISFAKGLKIDIQQLIEIEIIEMSSPYYSIFKGVKMMAFDVVFTCNVALPDYIGLGKGVSKGFGIITKIQQ